MIIGRWSIRLRPVDDELLTSYLARSAAVHGLTPYRFANYFVPGAKVWKQDIDCHASQELLDGLAAASGTTAQTLRAMTVQPWQARLSARPSGAPIPYVMVIGRDAIARCNHYLSFCPLCLEEQPLVHRRLGRLAFMVVCPRHGVPLRDACGQCDAPVRLSRSSPAGLETCYRCGCDIRGSDRGADSHESRHAAGQLQELLLSALSEERPTSLLGQSIGGREFLKVVRGLISIAATTGRGDRLRKALALGPLGDNAEDAHPRVLERMRSRDRREVLEAVGAWLQQDIEGFLEVARAACVTQKTFKRSSLPEVAWDVISRMPSGGGRLKKVRQPLIDPDLSQLMKAPERAKREERARRLLAAARVSG